MELLNDTSWYQAGGFPPGTFAVRGMGCCGCGPGGGGCTCRDGCKCSCGYCDCPR